MRSLKKIVLAGAFSVGVFTGYAEEPTTTPSFSELVMEGYRLETEKTFDQAVDSYTRALEIKEESVTVLIRRAYAYVQLGDFTRAGEDLKTAIYATPVTMSDYTSLSWLKATCPFDIVRDGVVAVAHAKKAMKETRSAETFDVLAAAYAEMNDFQRARNTLLEGIKLFPDSPRMEGMRERLALYKDKKPYRQVWVEGEVEDSDRKAITKVVQE